MEPISFKPIYQTRVWGGRSLETIYARQLPDDQPYGESWEISDRPDEQSIVTNGPFQGKSLHELWTHHRAEIFGDHLEGDRFPLLIKILDARDDLSIQVHPPLEIAQKLNGEPKTEMWYLAQADPDATLYLGLKKGTTRADFEHAVKNGTVAHHVHSIQPNTGQSIFIPSGRLHAIGAGFLIFEIQQNSDTTYRVFDWNRLGLDGNPRDLHLEQSLQSIDFQDFEPEMDTPNDKTLATCPFFQVDQLDLSLHDLLETPADQFSIIAVVSGTLQSHEGQIFKAGDFFLLPRSAPPLHCRNPGRFLQTTIPPKPSFLKENHLPFLI